MKITGLEAYIKTKYMEYGHGQMSEHYGIGKTC
jgi:hypothetical protein